MLFVPSPIQVSYEVMYSAIANKSGRMQYYRQYPGEGRVRIGRQDFIKAYNISDIIAMKPKQAKSAQGVFQLEFYVNKSMN